MKRQFIDLVLHLPLVLLTVSLRVGYSSSSSLPSSAISSSSSSSSAMDLCSKARQLVNYTKVEFAHGGFCSDSGPSCCHGSEKLILPGIEVLFGKSTFSQFSSLTTLLDDMKIFLKGLDCKLDDDNRQLNDLIKALAVLEEVDWATLIKKIVMSKSGCRLALTKLAFCTPNYCLINQSNVIGEGRFCRSDCTSVIRHCITEPFESISDDWKKAVGSLTTSLRLIVAHSPECREKKSQFDSFVNKWNDWRDPVSVRTNIYCANGHLDCPLSQQQVQVENGPWDKSILAPYSSKLTNVANTLEQYWLKELPDDTLSSGSGDWAESEDAILHTDDEDLLGPFEDGSGSGHSSLDPIINSNQPTISTTPSTINNNNRNPTTPSHGGGSSICTAAPIMYIITLLTPLILYFIPLPNL